MGEKGQVSLEFILVTGVLFIIVISLFPYLSQQNVLNKATTMARDGGIYALSLLNMGYTTSFDQDISYPTDKWRLKDVEIAYAGEVNSLKIYNLTLKVGTGGDDPPSSESNIGKFLGAVATNYIFYGFNGYWTTVDSNLWANGVTISDYKFYVRVEFESG